MHVFVRSHGMHAVLDAAYCYLHCMSVSVMSTRYAISKTPQPIVKRFWGADSCGPKEWPCLRIRNYSVYLRWCPDPSTGMGTLNGVDAVFCQITLDSCYY